MKLGLGNDTEKEVRVLVAEDDGVLAERTVDFLRNNGFNARVARNGIEARSILLTWKPDFIVYDLFLQEMNAIQFLKYLGPEMLGDDQMKVIVLSGHSHESNIREALKAGAMDYLVKPFKYIDLLARLVLHKQKKRTLPDLTADAKGSEQEASYYLHLADLTMREALKNLAPEETLFNLSRMVALSAKAVRVSIVQCDPQNRIGKVWGSSDLRHVKNLELDLNKYPEILYVLKSKKLLALENVAKDPAMSFVAKQNKSIQFNSMIVAPIYIGGSEPWGVLSARMPDTKLDLTDNEIRFVQLVAQVIGLTLLKDRNQAANLAFPAPAPSGKKAG